jgi:hypothetical protein
MKLKNGKYYVTNVMQLLGWIMKDGTVGTFDQETGLVKVEMQNKTTHETRTVYMSAGLVPVQSMEFKR